MDCSIVVIRFLFRSITRSVLWSIGLLAYITDLLRRATDLEDFSDDSQDSSEGKLEAIQMAWLEIYKEENA